MTVWTGRATIGASTNNFTIPFQPTWATFRVDGRVGGDTTNHISIGGTDGTRQNCGSTFTDGTGSASFDVNTKVVSHYERVSGTITEVLNATFSAFTSTGITITSTTPNTNYQVTIVCGT